jgi:glyoxylase-like metal-dependent hydrolase (beta-lactamase superfamily II)
VGEVEAVLIEPASAHPEEIERVVAWVREAERGGLALKAILVTHHHRDHVGGACALADRLRVPLLAHAATADRLEGEVAFDQLLEDGERVVLDGNRPISLRALHTPGHAPGHLCFLEESSGVMVAGDMVAAIGTILIEPRDGDMSAYLRSLDRMASERPAALIPAHGGVLWEPEAVLRGYVAHRLRRESRVVEALRHHGRPASSSDLVARVYADSPTADPVLAGLSIEAHLIKLAHDGLALRTPDGWLPSNASSSG